MFPCCFYTHVASLTKTQVQLYQFTRLVHDQCPAVFQHFERHGIEPFLYATPWFLSLFSSQFPLPFCERVMGMYLLLAMLGFLLS